jgi:ribonuclease P protein component
MPGLVLQVCRQEGEEGVLRPPRVGVTVTRKIGSAVTRNRVRRRLRAVARAVIPAAPVAGFDLVLIGRAETINRPFAALIADLQQALRGLCRAGGVACAGDERSPTREF